MTWNICGHESAAAFLRAHTQSDKLRHAYLITGPQGVGRRTLALAFIKALNCTKPPEPGDFCNQCTACRQINAQTYPDLTILEPAEGSKDLRIEQIRTMQQTLSLAPFQGKYRTILIPNFQQATTAASNALLKSLEEPPARAVLILTADSKESLLETISSRCETVRLGPLPVEQAQRYLEERFGIPADRAALLAHLSSGRIGAAIRYEQDPSLLDSYRNALETLEDLLGETKRARLRFVEVQLRQKGALREVVAVQLSAWLTFWRDVMIVSSGADVPLVNQEKAAFVGLTAGQVSLAEVELLLNLHEKALNQLDKYVNPRLVIENILVRLPHIRSIP